MVPYLAFLFEAPATLLIHPNGVKPQQLRELYKKHVRKELGVFGDPPRTTVGAALDRSNQEIKKGEQAIVRLVDQHDDYVVSNKLSPFAPKSYQDFCCALLGEDEVGRGQLYTHIKNLMDACEQQKPDHVIDNAHNQLMDDIGLLRSYRDGLDQEAEDSKE